MRERFRQLKVLVFTRRRCCEWELSRIFTGQRDLRQLRDFEARCTSISCVRAGNDLSGSTLSASTWIWYASILERRRGRHWRISRLSRSTLPLRSSLASSSLDHDGTERIHACSQRQSLCVEKGTPTEAVWNWWRMLLRESGDVSSISRRTRETERNLR